MLIATFAALAVAVATPAPAPTPANAPTMSSPPAAAATAARIDPGRRVCVVQRITGSMIPLRQCRTLADWQADGIDPFAKD